MRHPLVILSALLLPVTVHAANWETQALRTPGGGLIRVGTSAEEVKREMGPPLHQRAVRNGSGQKRGGREESWTYRGNDGFYTLKLSAGKVTRINVRADRD